MTAQGPVLRRLEAVALGVVCIAIVVGIVLFVSNSGPSSHPAVQTRHPAWPAPTLHDPQVVELTSANAGSLRLDPDRDYRLVLPRGKPLEAPNGLRIAGGHNVVLVGGTVNIPDHSGAGELEDQTGTIHVEGVRFTGRQLMEGLDLQEPDGATVELENLYFDPIYGTYTTNHADLIQTWAGPKRLLVDGLMGQTHYQGFFLLPNQHFSGPAPSLFEFRNVYIQDDGGEALWLQTSPHVPLQLSNVNVTPNPAKTWKGWWLNPQPTAANSTWSSVKDVPSAPSAIRRQIESAGLSYDSSS